MPAAHLPMVRDGVQHPIYKSIIIYSSWTLLLASCGPSGYVHFNGDGAVVGWCHLRAVGKSGRRANPGVGGLIVEEACARLRVRLARPLDPFPTSSTAANPARAIANPLCQENCPFPRPMACENPNLPGWPLAAQLFVEPWPRTPRVLRRPAPVPRWPNDEFL